MNVLWMIAAFLLGSAVGAYHERLAAEQEREQLRAVTAVLAATQRVVDDRANCFLRWRDVR